MRTSCDNIVMRVSVNHLSNYPDANAPQALLGGLSIAQFLRDYWHKKPLLVRQAIPQFAGLLSPNELAGLACEEDVQSRLVLQKGQSWQLEQGPFAEKRFSKLPNSDWSLLVQSVNHHLPEAQQLLQQFNFLPYARLDDLMVSYAPDGGGVGPHFDSYDVFLLQGMGQRRWRISEQSDLTLVENAPLKILQNFITSQEWLLDAGDMLYLPPHLAHWGIAVGECMTYSIGFRAATHDELMKALLNYLHDMDWGDERYQDADLQWSPEPAQIGDYMIQKMTQFFAELTLTPDLIGQFLASYFSEPKPHIVIDGVAKKISLQGFVAKACKFGLQLGLKSQMLYSKDEFFLNGERLEIAPKQIHLIRQLANHRALKADVLSQMECQQTWQLLYTFFLNGCVELINEQQLTK
jgi:50S ribosomal protein L16 3-hydroxylase